VPMHVILAAGLRTHENDDGDDDCPGRVRACVLTHRARDSSSSVVRPIHRGRLEDSGRDPWPRALGGGGERERERERERGVAGPVAA